MPKNKGRGGKNFRRGKHDNLTKRLLELKEDGQDYAQVIKLLGSGRLVCICLGDSKQRLGHIRGKMRRKVWIQNGDIVLVALRDFQDEKCDVCYKYFPEEIKQLKNLKEIPESLEENGEPADFVNFYNKEESESESSSSSDEEEDSENSDSEGERRPQKQKQKQVVQQQQQPVKKAVQEEKQTKIKREEIDDI